MSKIIFNNGLLIDGKGKMLERSSVAVSGNMIEEVGKPIFQKIPEGVQIIDITGKTIMPGLIDAHTHHARVSGSSLEGAAVSTYPSKRTLQGYLNFLDTLYGGFTSVRDVGGSFYIDLAVRDMVNGKKLIGPRVVGCGRAICQTGGHPAVTTQLPWAPLPEPVPEIVDGEVEVRRAVRKQVLMGVDFIKMFVSSGIYDPFLGRPRPEFSRGEIGVAIEEAHAAGKKIAMHCHLSEVAKTCIELGADSIEHGIFIDEDTLKMMADYGTSWVPTLLVYENIAGGLKKGVSLSSVNNAKRGLQHVKKIFIKALEMGNVNICVGTDAGTVLTPHGSNSKELKIFNNWGMSATDCIVAATSKNAALLGISEFTGSIEKNKEADLLVINGNPLNDISILQDHSNIQIILKGGEFVKNSLSS